MTKKTENHTDLLDAMKRIVRAAGYDEGINWDAYGVGEMRVQFSYKKDGLLLSYHTANKTAADVWTPDEATQAKSLQRRIGIDNGYEHECRALKRLEEKVKDANQDIQDTHWRAGKALVTFLKEAGIEAETHSKDDHKTVVVHVAFDQEGLSDKIRALEAKYQDKIVAQQAQDREEGGWQAQVKAAIMAGMATDLDGKVVDSVDGVAALQMVHTIAQDIAQEMGTHYTPGKPGFVAAVAARRTGGERVPE